MSQDHIEEAKKKVEEIMSKVEKGRIVVIAGVKVRTIDIVPSRRSVKIVINDGEKAYYPSEFIKLKVVEY